MRFSGIISTNLARVHFVNVGLKATRLVFHYAYNLSRQTNEPNFDDLYKNSVSCCVWETGPCACDARDDRAASFD